MISKYAKQLEKINESLEAERDKLLQILSTERNAFGKRETELMAKIDLLEAELEQTKIDFEIVNDACDEWKSKAEKFAEAIRKHNCNNGDDVHLEVAIDKYEQGV